MLLSKDRIGGVLLLIFCIIYAYLSQQIKLLPFQAQGAFTPRTMPEVLSVLGIGFSVLIIIFPSSAERPEFSEVNWKLGVLFLALMSVYGFTIRPAGFLLSTSVFLIAGFALLGERNIAKLLLVSLPLVFGFWALMNYGLSVFIEPLPFFLRG